MQKLTLDRVTLRQLSRRLNDWAACDKWKRPQSLEMRHTYFDTSVSPHSGFNGVHRQAKLTTDLIKCRSILLERWHNTGLELYLNAPERRERDSGDRWEERTLFILRDAKGKRQQLTLSRDSHKQVSLIRDEASRLRSLSGESRFVSEEEEESEVYFQTAKNFRYKQKEFREMLKGLGFSIVNEFDFTMKLDVYLTGAKISAKRVVLNYETHGTYCSHPGEIVISMVRKIKTVRLSDIGAEKRGYYSHDNQFEVLPEQAAEAKAFAKRCARAAKGYTPGVSDR